MDCEQAHRLFDAYLDGELSPRLTTELGAHRLRCPDCRRALALLEVTGHIIASDDESATLNAAFSERLLACMESPRMRWKNRARRALYVAGPLAAAAVIVLAFVGVFDSPRIRVAGKKVEGVVGELPSDFFEPPTETDGSTDHEAARRAQALERSVEQWQASLAKKGESVELLKDNLDMTIIQFLDVLEEAKDETPGAGHFPGAAPAEEPKPQEPGPAEGADAEDP